MNIAKSLLRSKRKKESWLKYIMSVLHLWLGLLSSIVIIIVCLTGSIYTFKNQIIDAYNHDKVYITPQYKPYRSLDSIQNSLKNRGLELTHITIPDSPKKSLKIVYDNGEKDILGSYYVNPYSGEILGTGDHSLERFFSVVLNLHKSLLLSGLGKQIVGASILIFVFMLFSGFILWLPKKWKQLKNGLKIKWNARFYRLNYDLHNVLGFYFMLLLFLISITGLYVSYPWVKSGLIVALGGNPVLTANADEATKEALSNDFQSLLEEMMEKENENSTLQDAKPASLDSIYKLSNEKLPYESITVIALPSKENSRFLVKKINRENWLKALLPDELSFSKTGELKKVNLFKDKPLNKQFVEISLPLHTGEILGWPSLIFYFLTTLVGTSLPITGFIIWWKKKR